LLILRVLQVNNSLLSDLIDTDITNCHIVSNTYWGHHDSPLLRAANTTVFIHSVLADKLSLTLKITGKVTDSDTVLVFCLMYSQSQCLSLCCQQYGVWLTFFFLNSCYFYCMLKWFIMSYFTSVHK
jgi:hypothetical protein